VSPVTSYELRDGVAVITIDDGKANALSSALLAEVNSALDKAAVDDAVVLLCGRPGIFSGGFDLKVMRGGGRDAATMLEDGFQLALRLLSYPAPVVLACTGHAIAMGSFILLSVDYRIGARGAYKIVANEVAIGMTLPWTAVEICRHRLAPAHFYRAVNLSEVYSPDGAVAAGFLDETVEETALMERALEFCAGMTMLSRAAHVATKSRTRENAIAAIEAGFSIDHELFQAMSA
jgi:enoyl-CoA hydratase